MTDEDNTTPYTHDHDELLCVLPQAISRLMLMVAALAEIAVADVSQEDREAVLTRVMTEYKDWIDTITPILKQLEAHEASQNGDKPNETH